MSYATYTDVEARMNKTFSESEQSLCSTLLEDAAVIIDAYNSDAKTDAKKVVSCRMVIRAMGTGSVDVPVGSTQGSMSALGYSQSWTISAGATGELYLSKLDKTLLGCGNKLGARSPLEGMAND